MEAGREIRKEDEGILKEEKDRAITETAGGEERGGVTVQPE